MAIGIATTPRKGLTQQQSQYTIADNTTKAIIIQTSFIALQVLERGLFQPLKNLRIISASWRISSIHFALSVTANNCKPIKRNILMLFSESVQKYFCNSCNSCSCSSVKCLFFILVSSKFRIKKGTFQPVPYRLEKVRGFSAPFPYFLLARYI